MSERKKETITAANANENWNNRTQNSEAKRKPSYISLVMSDNWKIFVKKACEKIFLTDLVLKRKMLGFWKIVTQTYSVKNHQVKNIFKHVHIVHKNNPYQ